MADGAVLSLRLGWHRFKPAWSVRPIRRAFAGALTARAAQAMMPLTILLLFRQRTGSFAAAGAAVTAYSLASVFSSPAIARLADRWGSPVLASAGAVNAASLIALAVTPSPATSWIAVTVAGASAPPLAAALRATIVSTLSAERDRAAVFSLDAIATELLFVVGPAVVSAATALGKTADALFAASGLVVLGSVLSARSDRPTTGRPTPSSATAHSPRPGQARLLARWLAVTAAQMAAIGFVEVAAAARVIQFGEPAAAGTVLAVWAAGSIAGGIIYSSRDWPGQSSAHLRVLLLALAAGFAIVTAARSMMVLYPLMFTAGLACAPAAAALTASFSAHMNRAEHFAWLAACGSLGGAVGYAAAGLLIAHTTITATILAGAALPAAAAASIPRTAPPRRPVPPI